MKVYASISQVSARLAKEGISKDRNNNQQGYKFRGIDDVLNALAPLLSESSLVILPEVLERECVERQTKHGGTLFYVTTKVRYTFVNTEDFSKHESVVYGEAMDSADKATNKAMSAAYKYLAIQAFCIPTEGDNDADATTHEVTPQQRQQQAIQRNKQAAQAAIADLKREASAPGATPFPGPEADTVDGPSSSGQPSAAPSHHLTDVILAVREAGSDQELNVLLRDFCLNPAGAPSKQDKETVDKEVAARRKQLRGK